MPSFKSMITMLLISGVFAIEGNHQRLVRKNAVEMGIEADGTVKSASTGSNKVLPASMVGMSVSAKADADMLSDASLSSKVERMLAEVEEMSRSGASPAPHKSKAIQGIVKDELLPGLKSERDFAEEQVKNSVAAIGKCNKNSLSKQTDIKGSTEVEVDKARKTHVACRDNEKTKHSTKKSKCIELDGFLDTVRVPQELPKGRKRDDMVQYVRAMNKYFCPMEPRVSEMDEACKKATNEHSTHRAGCNRKQAAFESDFCTWRTSLSDNCDASSACYKTATDVYDGVKANTTTLVKKLKVEYAACKKIMCYLEVWLSDNNADTANGDQFDKCNGASVDTSPMLVDYPDAPAQAACPLTAVEKYPGTPEFESTEYSNHKGYAQEVIPCITLDQRGISTKAAEAKGGGY